MSRPDKSNNPNLKGGEHRKKCFPNDVIGGILPTSTFNVKAKANQHIPLPRQSAWSRSVQRK